MSFTIKTQRTAGVLSTGDVLNVARHGECVLVSIPDVHSLIVRRESDSQYLNISGLYFGPGAKIVRREVTP